MSAKRGRGVLPRFALLLLTTCLIFPTILHKIITHHGNTEFDNSSPRGRIFHRTRRWVFENESTQLRAESTSPRNCVEPSIDDFPDDFMTQYQRLKQGGVIFHFLIAIYMFGSLAIVCDEYFVPSLEKITVNLHMHSDVAGATFMAAGSSAPELFTSIFGVFITKGDIGLGTIVGSAVFNILFIVAICGLFAGCSLRLSPWPLLRDSACYLLSIAALIAITYDKEVYWYEALVLVIMYLLYVNVMYFNSALEGWFKSLVTTNKNENSTAEEGKTLLSDNEDNVNPATSEEDDRTIGYQDDEPAFSMPTGFTSGVLWILSLPIVCLLYVTIPDCRKERWKNWYPASFAMSVVWIALLSYVLVWMVSIVGFTLGIPDVIMGLTFLAAGSSVPDGISSLIVARQGDGDMAVANTIGSNVFDILLCLGLPWLLQTTAVDFGGYVKVISGSIIYTSISLFGTVFVTIFLIVGNKWYLTRCLGGALLALYLSFISVATLFELNIFGKYNLPICAS